MTTVLTICSVRNYSLKEHGMPFVVDSVNVTGLHSDLYLSSLELRQMLPKLPSLVS